MKLSGLKAAPAVALVVGGLVVGLSAPAAARETKHLISGSSIKEHSIAANRLKSHTLTGTQIKSKSLTGSQLKNDSLTGTQIKESTLGTVPNANALGGTPASSFAKQIATRLVLAPGTNNGATMTSTYQIVGIGTINLGCASNNQPIVQFKNNTSSNQDISVVMDVPGQPRNSLGGPPYGAGLGVTFQLSDMYWTFDALSATSAQAADLSLSAYTNAQNQCYFGLRGTSSIPIT
jgi:hypothetical protein